MEVSVASFVVWSATIRFLLLLYCSYMCQSLVNDFVHASTVTLEV